VRCLVCCDARIVQCTEGEQGIYAVIARYDSLSQGAPARVLIECPACARGMSHPLDCFMDLQVHEHQRKAVARARAIALSSNPVGWLVLTGGYGTGKSTVLDALCDTLRSRGLHPRICTAPEFRQSMYDARREYGLSAWLASIKRTRVLAIDELDSVKWSDQDLEESLSELLNARYQAARTTLTMLAGADLGAVPGRIKSRMAEFGILDLGKTDLRAADGGLAAV